MFEFLTFLGVLLLLLENQKRRKAATDLFTKFKKQWLS